MRATRGHRFGASPVAGPPAVGLTMIESMLMTPGAQASEMQRIDNDMRLFNDEIAKAADGRGAHIAPIKDAADIARYAHDVANLPQTVANDPVVTLYRTIWMPLYQTWAAFYAANKSGAWWSNPVSEAEKYQDQLIDIRAQLAGLGVKLQSPGPKQEHPEGLPTWFWPAAGIGGGIALLMIITRD